MGLFNEISKAKARKIFFSSITDESLEFYNDNLNKQSDAYDEILDAGWCLGKNKNLFKTGTRAYLERTDDGYVIPSIEQKDIDYLYEHKFLVTHKVAIDKFFEADKAIEAFNNGYWEVKYDKNERYVEEMANKIGITKERHVTVSSVFPNAQIQEWALQGFEEARKEERARRKQEEINKKTK